MNSEDQVLNNLKLLWNHQELLIANYPKCDHPSLKTALDRVHISSKSSESSSSMIDKIATCTSQLFRTSKKVSLKVIYSMVNKPAQTCT